MTREGPSHDASSEQSNDLDEGEPPLRGLAIMSLSTSEPRPSVRARVITAQQPNPHVLLGPSGQGVALVTFAADSISVDVGALEGASGARMLCLGQRLTMRQGKRS
jgi:hypothetical protein